MMRCTILVENHALPGLTAEHGLSLLVERNGEKLLFDTGAGKALEENCKTLNINALPEYVFLSHGHNDHTGGIGILDDGKTVFAAEGIGKKRFSCHPGKPVRDLSMPENRLTFVRISAPAEILPGMFATGPIPRLSGEDCGGPFFLDPEKKMPDTIADEQALLLKEGVLIQGCCHAGIINTLEHCRKSMPEIRIHTIIGGLHLLLADETRLKETADYLRESAVKRLYLLHCTGENAIAYLRDALPDCAIFTPVAGETLVIP